MNRNARIAVVGGSLIGPLTSLLLRKSGFRNVTVFEAASAARPQSGGVIGMREWNVPVLESVGIPRKEFVAYPGHEVTTYDIKNREITDLRDDVMYPGETTAWDLFHQAVASRTEINYGTKVIGLDPSPQGARLTLRAPQGEMRQQEFDVVVFADGRNSTGRKILDSKRRLEYQGYIVWRGLFPTPTGGPKGKPVGFERYRDDSDGILFSISEAITHGAHAGESDWTLYHNLGVQEFKRMNNGLTPTERPFMLPLHMTPYAHYLMCSIAFEYLPDYQIDVVRNTKQIMAVPINEMPMPEIGVKNVGGGIAVLLGDALKDVRPHSGRGVNVGIEQANGFTQALGETDWQEALISWDRKRIADLAQWVELGQVRARRNGLGK